MPEEPGPRRWPPGDTGGDESGGDGGSGGGGGDGGGAGATEAGGGRGGNGRGSAAVSGASRAPEEGREGWWAAFKASPFLPATVLVFILAAAAGLFAGSYTYSMANPTPHHIPTGVIGAYDEPHGRAFVAGMEKALNASLDLKPYSGHAAAADAIEEQRVFAVLDVHGGGGGRGATLDVSGASGQSVAQLLQQAGPAVGREIGVPVRVRDVNPLQRGDPRGLAIFYITLASVVIGFVGAMQLNVHARGLNPFERILMTLAYALFGGFTIAALVDWGLGALRLPFAESWLILVFTMFTAGMVATMFTTLFGRWAMLPTWGLMVILGNPSSGGAVSWPLLPSLLGTVGRWLPPGASVNAQHTAVYFGGNQHAFPFLVLAAWALVSCAVFWIWRHRHPGGRPADGGDGPGDGGGGGDGGDAGDDADEWRSDAGTVGDGVRHGVRHGVGRDVRRGDRRGGGTRGGGDGAPAG